MSDVWAELLVILERRLNRVAKARAVAEALQHAGGYHWVGLYDVDATHIRAIAWTGAVAPAFPSFLRSQGLNGAAVASGQALVVQDVTRDSRWLTTFGTSKAEAIFPVTLHGVVVGTIDVESDRIGAFTAADESLLRRAAEVLQPLWDNRDAV
jgi:L-methionine (R)-S-oxide reductase